MYHADCYEKHIKKEKFSEGAELKELKMSK